jgi:YcxB-like protein
VIPEKPCDIVDSAMIAPDQADELVIPVQLNKSDISQSVKLRALASPLFWLVPLWVIGLVYFLLTSSLHTPRWYAWGWALIAGLMMLFFLHNRSSALIAKQPGALAPMKFVFSAYGITAEFENGTNKAMWSLVKGARETGHYFFIEMQRRSFNLIPKRLLTDEQASHLREILRANVSKNVHLLP